MPTEPAAPRRGRRAARTASSCSPTLRSDDASWIRHGAGRARADRRERLAVELDGPLLAGGVEGAAVLVGDARVARVRGIQARAGLDPRASSSSSHRAAMSPSASCSPRAATTLRRIDARVVRRRHRSRPARRRSPRARRGTSWRRRRRPARPRPAPAARPARSGRTRCRRPRRAADRRAGGPRAPPSSGRAGSAPCGRRRPGRRGGPAISPRVSRRSSVRSPAAPSPRWTWPPGLEAVGDVHQGLEPGLVVGEVDDDGAWPPSPAGAV